MSDNNSLRKDEMKEQELPQFIYQEPEEFAPKPLTISYPLLPTPAFKEEKIFLPYTNLTDQQVAICFKMPTSDRVITPASKLAPRKNTFKQQKQKENLDRMQFLMLAGLIASIAVHGLVKYWGKFNISSLFMEKVVAQSIPASEQPIPTIYVNGIPTPDWNQITFRSLKFSGSGNSDVPVPETPIPGLKTTRIWNEGQGLSEVMELGDFEGIFGIEELALQKIADFAGIELANLPLSDFQTLQWQTLTDLVAAIPELGEISIDSIAPLADLASSVTGQLLSGSVSSVIENYPDLAVAQLGEYISLSDYSLTSIPNIEQVALKEFSNWQSTVINGIPGLENIPFSYLSNVPVPDFSFIGNVDLPLNANEANRSRSISGSNQAGFNVSCVSPCAHIELSGNNNLTGAQWISGKDQKNIKGGFGLLKVMNGGKEPTGRHPYGSSFKQVIWDVQEAKGDVTTAMFFRKCHRGIPDLGCSPYFIGPVVYFTYHEKDPMALGLPILIP
ncbi:hypothetical protein [Chlorogloea sp. CCALA 695]|uniref:hypothetical protein n=1 Tax=Chlorogloea sp. CCALA 695 TaxID=2107693 RepID=UPI0011B1DE05|nr:hypothetical protein [Chlorogloea sp. CCALA 695]